MDTQDRFDFLVTKRRGKYEESTWEPGLTYAELEALLTRLRRQGWDRVEKVATAKNRDGGK